MRRNGRLRAASCAIVVPPNSMLRHVVEFAMARKEVGTELFKKGRYIMAFERYKKVGELLAEDFSKNYSDFFKTFLFN